MREVLIVAVLLAGCATVPPSPPAPPPKLSNACTVAIGSPVACPNAFTVGKFPIPCAKCSPAASCYSPDAGVWCVSDCSDAACAPAKPDGAQ